MDVSERHNSTAERLQPAKATVSSRVESREQTEQTLVVVVYIGRPETEMKPENEAFDDLPPNENERALESGSCGDVFPGWPDLKGCCSLGEVTSRNAVMG
jgi:hypothetical protein